MKSIYIVLTRSTTIVSRMVHFVTLAEYTHVSISFDKDLRVLYSSSRKNGRTIFPAGPCLEFIDKGYFKRHGDIPCAVFELRVMDRIYYRAKREADELMRNSNKYHFNILGLLLCNFNIQFNRANHFFCSQFVSEILTRSEAMSLPKPCTLMKPIDYASLSQLECVYSGKIEDIREEYACF